MINNYTTVFTCQKLKNISFFLLSVLNYRDLNGKVLCFCRIFGLLYHLVGILLFVFSLNNILIQYCSHVSVLLYVFSKFLYTVIVCIMSKFIDGISIYFSTLHHLTAIKCSSISRLSHNFIIVFSLYKQPPE